MSIGSFFGRTGKALGGLWDAVEAPPQFVWDLAKAIPDKGLSAGLLATTWASFTDRGGQILGGTIGPEGFGGQLAGGLPEGVRKPIRRTIGTGASPDQKGLGGDEFFGGGILGFFEATGREFIREPLTTAMTVGSLADRPGGKGWGAFVDGDSWRYGHEIAQSRSLGQSIALAFMTKDILSEDEITKAQGTGSYKFWSGAWDAAARMFLDADSIIGGTLLEGTRGATATGRLRYAEEFATTAADNLQTLQTAQRGRAAIVEGITQGTESALGPRVGRVLKVQKTTPAMAAGADAAALFGEAGPSAWTRTAQTLLKDKFSDLDSAVQRFEAGDPGDLYKWAGRNKVKLNPSDLTALDGEGALELITRRVAEKRKYSHIDLLDDTGQVEETVPLTTPKEKPVLTEAGVERAATKMSYEELSRRDAAWATWQKVRNGGWDNAIESANGRYQDSLAALADARESFMQSRQWKSVSADILTRTGVWARPASEAAPTLVTAEKAAPKPSAFTPEAADFQRSVYENPLKEVEDTTRHGAPAYVETDLASLPELYRQRHILSRLLGAGELTPAEYDKYMKAIDEQELGISGTKTPLAEVTTPASDVPLKDRPVLDRTEVDSLAAQAGLERQGTMTLSRRIERIRDRYFHNTTDGEQLATWLANAHNQAELDAVMRVALGEFKNLDALRAMNPALHEDMMRVFMRRLVQRTLPWEDGLKFHQEEFAMYNDPAAWGRNGRLGEVAQGYGRELDEVIEQLAAQGNDPDFIAKELAVLRQGIEDSNFLHTGAGMAGAAREAITHSRVYQSRANITRIFFDMAAPNTIEVNDPMVTGKIRRHLRDAGMSPETQEEILGQWAAVRDNPNARQNLLRRISDEGVKTLAAKHGIDDPDEIAYILENIKKAQTEGTLLLRSSARYAGVGPGGRELSRVQLVDAVTGEISHIYSPLTPAQLNKAELMPNFRQIDKSMKWWGEMKRKHPSLRTAMEAPRMLMEELNKAWKVSALLRPAWPMRVVFDEQVRMVGVLGLMEHLSGKTAALRDLRMNYMRDFFPLRDPDRNVQWMSVDDQGRLALTKEPLSSTANKAVDLKRAKIGSSVVGGMIGGLLGGTEGAIAGAALGYRAGKRGGELANGLSLLHESHTRKVALDGYRMAAALGNPGDVANLFHDQVSAQRQMDQLQGISPTEIYKQMRLDPRRWRYYTPGEEGYEIFWNRSTNFQFSNSEFTRLLWNDDVSNDAIVQWLTEGKGRATLRSMPVERQRNVDEWVNNARDFTRQLIPDTVAGQELRAAKARGEKVTMAQMQEALGPDWADQLGSVHGMEFIELADRRSPVVRVFRQKVDNIMRHLGTTPTDTLSRHPYFEKVYTENATRELAKLQAGADGMFRLTQADLDAISNSARRSALTEVRSLLYDLAEQSHFAQAVSFISPFYMAWQEVITRYAGIAYDNPVFASRALKIYNSAGKADLRFMGMDTYTDESTGNEFIRFKLPDSARALLSHGIFKGAIDDQGQMMFDKKGINMLSQGIPSVGPIAALPVSWAVKDRPELEESLRVLFPYGLPDASLGGAAESFLPTGARRAVSLGTDDRSMAAVKARILQTKITAAAERGEPYDLNDKLVVDKLLAEVDDESKALGRLRIASAFISPVAVSYQSPYQEFIDEFYKLRDEDYLTAAEKFRDKHGDAYFALTQSFSKVNDGVQATYQAEAVRKKYKDLVEAYPDYGSLIVGDEGGGLGVQFIRSIYERQFQEDVSVGDPRKRREMLPLNVVATDPDRRLGWIKYSRFNDWLTDQMDRAGITNLSVKKAAPLLAVKRFFVENLATQHPSWYLDYSDTDDNKWSTRMTALRAIVNDGPPELTKRPDIEGLRQYLTARQSIEQVLAARKEAGGSGNLGANENADVRAAWETIGLSLSERNLAFSDLYARWLQNDPVSEPSWAA